MTKNSEKYDAIIIGAGIGGLMCGCFLAKTGLKVLIVEKHTKPGGYFSSFNRGGFLFDSCIHYLKLSKKQNFFYDMFKEFDIEKHVVLNKVNTSDLIVTPAGEFYVCSDVQKTIGNLVELFPKDEKDIRNFFKFLNTQNTITLYYKTKGRSFFDLIREYIKNNEIISIFDCLLMNIGLPIHKVHALKAYYFFREFFFTQSYYPAGGMQRVPDALNKIFVSYGGKVRYGMLADKILVNGNTAYGVKTGDTSIATDFVISNVDPYQTFIKLLGSKYISSKLFRKINRMTPSISAYILYLGLSDKISGRYPINSSIWYFPKRTFSAIYKSIVDNKPGMFNDYLICSFPSSHNGIKSALNDKMSLSIVLGTFFKTRNYWERNSRKIAGQVIERARDIFPNIQDCINVSSIATPYTLYDYTGNYQGACYGLASIKSQMDRSFMPQKTDISNLLMAGHWTTHGFGQGGLSMAAYSGVLAAKCVLNERMKRKI